MWWVLLVLNAFFATLMFIGFFITGSPLNLIVGILNLVAVFGCVYTIRHASRY